MEQGGIKKDRELGMVAMPVIPATQKECKFKASLGDPVRPCLKIKYIKDWGCCSVVKCLPSTLRH